MNRRQWVHGTIGGAAVVLAALNIWGSESNRAAAGLVEAQRTELARVQRVATINNGLIQLLVKATVERDDAALRALLAANGVTFKLNDTGAAPGQPSSVAPAAPQP